MTTALEIAKQDKPPSKMILEKLKQRYVAWLEQAFFDYYAETLFNMMNKEDQADLLAFEDRQLVETYPEVVKLLKKVPFDTPLGHALSEWDDMLEFQYGRATDAERAA